MRKKVKECHKVVHSVLIIIVIGLSGGVALLGIRRDERWYVLPQGDQYALSFCSWCFTYTIVFVWAETALLLAVATSIGSSVLDFAFEVAASCTVHRWGTTKWSWSYDTLCRHDTCRRWAVEQVPLTCASHTHIISIMLSSEHFVIHQGGLLSA